MRASWSRSFESVHRSKTDLEASSASTSVSSGYLITQVGQVSWRPERHLFPIKLILTARAITGRSHSHCISASQVRTGKRIHSSSWLYPNMNVLVLRLSCLSCTSFIQLSLRMSVKDSRTIRTVGKQPSCTTLSSFRINRPCSLSFFFSSSSRGAVFTNNEFNPFLSNFRKFLPRLVEQFLNKKHSLGCDR